MARNGSGTYSLPAGNPFVTGTTISSTTMNSTLSDIATALTQSLSSDGQTTPSANIPMGNFKITSLGNGTAATDAAAVGQIQSSAVQWLSGVSGADTITAGISPTPAAYAAGQTFRFVSAGANTGAVTLNISSLGAKSVTKNGTTALAAGDIPSGAVATVTYDGTQFQLMNVAQATIPSDQTARVNDFRLTLTTGTPGTTADVTGATTIYCTPYKGNLIALYDGTRWNIRKSAEFSLALGTLTSAKPYDVFCYDNAGTPTLEFLAWTDDTTRATALAYQDGVLVKSGAATRRYLGTFYTTATTTTEDSVANRYLWNYYHRISRKMQAFESTASWTYTTNTWRQVRAAATNQLNLVVGVNEDLVTARTAARASNAGAAVAIWSAVGLDSTSAPSSDCVQNVGQTQTSGNYACNGFYAGLVGAGKHILVNLERSSASGTTSWNGTASGLQIGIVGEVMA